MIRADEGALGVRVYHYVNLGLLGLTPIAMVTPAPMTFGMDMILALALPLHGHIGMNYVLTDYVPKVFGKAGRGPARLIMFGITGFTAAGLLKLNFFGAGVTGALKNLWRK